MTVNVLKRNENNGATSAAKWNERLRFIMRQAQIMILVVKHPAVPWPAKMIAAFSVGYIFSPIQLIPTFIPIVGQLDDLAVLLVGMKLVRRLASEDVLAECESKVQKTFYIDARAATQGDHHEPEAA